MSLEKLGKVTIDVENSPTEATGFAGRQIWQYSNTELPDWFLGAADELRDCLRRRFPKKYRRVQIAIGELTVRERLCFKCGRLPFSKTIWRKAYATTGEPRTLYVTPEATSEPDAEVYAQIARSLDAIRPKRDADVLASNLGCQVDYERMYRDWEKRGCKSPREQPLQVLCQRDIDAAVSEILARSGHRSRGVHSIGRSNARIRKNECKERSARGCCHCYKGP